LFNFVDKNIGFILAFQLSVNILDWISCKNYSCLYRFRNI